MTQIKNFKRVEDGLENYLLKEEKKLKLVKPFDCPFLVILSEPISIGGNGFVKFGYEKGSCFA